MFSWISRLSASSSCLAVVLISSVSSVSCTWLYTTSVTAEKTTPKHSTAAALRRRCRRGLRFFFSSSSGSSTTFSWERFLGSSRGCSSGWALSHRALETRSSVEVRSSNREKS